MSVESIFDVTSDGGRSTLEIAAAILENLDECENRRELYRKTGISNNRSRKYLEWLEDNKLVAEEDEWYDVTRWGRQFLMHWRRIKELIVADIMPLGLISR